jgi:hypothetical protein
LYVGGAGEASVVTGSSILLQAEGGDRGVSDGPGGGGYSGGGGHGYYCNGCTADEDGGDGGSDGGDGKSVYWAGGKGSGLNVSEIQLTGFTLNPGSGGANCGYSGAGGGGVLINGLGPLAKVRNHGNGYGAGGGAAECGCYDDDDEEGYSGAIIFNIYT